MNLVLRDPFFGDLDALFPGFFRGPRRTAGPTPELPRLTSYTDEAGYVLEAEVPGLAPADVDVTVDDGVITLKASASGEESDDDGRITRRFASGFERSFRVPADVMPRRSKRACPTACSPSACPRWRLPPRVRSPSADG